MKTRPDLYAAHTPAQLDILLGECQRGRKPKTQERRALLAYILKFKKNDPLYGWDNRKALGRMFQTSKSTLYEDLKSLNLSLPKQPRGRYARPAVIRVKNPSKPAVRQRVAAARIESRLELTPAQERELERVARERLLLEERSRRNQVGCQGNQMGKYGYTGG